MFNRSESTLPLVVINLQHIQNASQVLAECLTRYSEEPQEIKAQQMERLCGVAFLMDLISEQVETARIALKKEIAAG